MIVLCNGMLRSGSSLQFNMVRLLLAAAGQSDPHTAFIERPTCADIDTLPRDGRAVVIKTHHYPLPEIYRALGVRIVYSHRDLRDVAASIRKKWQEPFDEILDDLRYLLDVRQQLRALPAGTVLWQSYSDLTTEPGTAARQIAAYLGLGIKPDTVADITRQLTLDTVQRSLSQRDPQAWSQVGGVDPTTFFHHDHISADKGRDGTWQRVLSQQEVARIEDLIATHSPRASAGASA